jgi:CheY-like chemotaxis protein
MPRAVVIDDDTTTLLIFRTYLESGGFGVQSFSNSTEA